MRERGREGRNEWVSEWGKVRESVRGSGSKQVNMKYDIIILFCSNFPMWWWTIPWRPCVMAALLQCSGFPDYCSYWSSTQTPLPTSKERYYVTFFQENHFWNVYNYVLYMYILYMYFMCMHVCTCMYICTIWHEILTEKLIWWIGGCMRELQN